MGALLSDSESVRIVDGSEMKRFEIGVFLPVAKNGFIFSTNSPPYVPSFRVNLEITRLAERIGLDYVFGLSKWRGWGGKTQFWDSSFETFSLMAALAASTNRVRLIATVNPLLFHPTLMAKMISTIDDVSGGRIGLNIITGAVLGEYSQMGIVPEGYDQYRYAYATEWLTVLKRLWTESSVTHDGVYFQLDDCVSEPKPLQKPYPFLVCAAASDEGLRFTAEHADWSFINGKDFAEVKQQSLRSKEIADGLNRTIKTAVSVLCVIRDTNAEAVTYFDFLTKGADLEAMANNAMAFSSQSRASAQKLGAERLSSSPKIHTGRAVVGTPSDVAEQLIDLAFAGSLDSALLTFPDFLDGLHRFELGVMPLLRTSLDVGLVAK